MGSKDTSPLDEAIKALEERLYGTTVGSASQSPGSPEPKEGISPQYGTNLESGAKGPGEEWHCAEESWKPESDGQGPSRREPYVSITYGPMVYITTTFVTFPSEPKEIRFFLGFSPFETFDATPPQHYLVKEGYIVKDPKVYKSTMEPEIEALGAKAHRKRSQTYDPKKSVCFTISGISAWTRSEYPHMSLKCLCSPHYATKKEDHSDRLMCQARAFGAYVADKLWNNQAIEGAKVPKNFLLE